MRIDQLPAKVTKNGIRVATKVTDDKGNFALLEVYAKPCSPNCFEISFNDFDGTEYRLDIDDNLPTDKFVLDMENPFEISKLAHLVKETGHFLGRRSGVKSNH